MILWTLVVLALSQLGSVLTQAGALLDVVYVGPPAQFSGCSHAVASGLGQLVVAPIIEELAFRWLLFDALRTRWSFATSAWLSSVAFVLVHVGPSGDRLEIFVFGLAMAYGYERTRSILPLVLAHSLYNAEWFIGGVLLSP